MTLSAYKNSQELKDKLIEQMTAHKLADELIKGQYWAADSAAESAEWLAAWSAYERMADQLLLLLSKCK